MLNQQEINAITSALIAAKITTEAAAIECNSSDYDWLRVELIDRLKVLNSAIEKIESMCAAKHTDHYKCVYESDGYIAAIKAYRNDSGLSLRDSKNQIQKWVAGFNWKKP